MKIDKRTGYFNLKNSIYLDDIAFQIYINVSRIRNNKRIKLSQDDFISWYGYKCKYYNTDFYQQAKLILRNEKINKIKKSYEQK